VREKKNNRIQVNVTDSYNYRVAYVHKCMCVRIYKCVYASVCACASVCVFTFISMGTMIAWRGDSQKGHLPPQCSVSTEMVR
jgi:hypothetical protein